MSVTALSYLPKMNRVFSASRDSLLLAWDVDSGFCVGKLVGHDGPVLSLAKSEEYDFVLSGGSDKCVRVWGASSLELVAEHDDCHRISALAVRNETFYTGGGDGTVTVYDMAVQHCWGVLKPKVGKGILSLCSYQNTLFSGTSDGVLRAWDCRAGLCVASLQSANPHAIHAIVIAGTRLYCGSDDGSVDVWDLLTMSHAVTLQGHGHRVNALATNSEQSLVYSGSDDNTVKVWSVRGTSEPVARLRAHSSAVNAIAICGPLLCTGDQAGSMLMWDSPHPTDANQQRAPGAKQRNPSTPSRRVQARAFTPPVSRGYLGSAGLWRKPDPTPRCACGTGERGRTQEKKERKKLVEKVALPDFTPLRGCSAGLLPGVHHHSARSRHGRQPLPPRTHQPLAPEQSRRDPPLLEMSPSPPRARPLSQPPPALAALPTSANVDANARDRASARDTASPRGAVFCVVPDSPPPSTTPRGSAHTLRPRRASVVAARPSPPRDDSLGTTGLVSSVSAPVTPVSMRIPMSPPFLTLLESLVDRHDAAEGVIGAGLVAEVGARTNVAPVDANPGVGSAVDVATRTTVDTHTNVAAVDVDTCPNVAAVGVDTRTNVGVGTDTRDIDGSVG